MIKLLILLALLISSAKIQLDPTELVYVDRIELNMVFSPNIPLPRYRLDQFLFYKYNQNRELELVDHVVVYNRRDVPEEEKKKWAQKVFKEYGLNVDADDYVLPYVGDTNHPVYDWKTKKWKMQLTFYKKWYNYCDPKTKRFLVISPVFVRSKTLYDVERSYPKQGRKYLFREPKRPE